MYFFLPSFCPFCFSSFCLFPIFFCFVSDSGVFLPALLAVLFFLFQKIFSFSFPAFCRTSFRSSCLHHPSALTRPVRPALHGLCRLSYFLFVSSVFRKDLPVRNFVFQVFTTFVPCLHFLSALNRFVRPAYRAFAVFLLFARVVRFPQRPSCPKFLLSGLYNLCPTPTSPSARKPTCPRTCLDSAPFFLPIFCSISIFCRFRVVFCF